MSEGDMLNKMKYNKSLRDVNKTHFKTFQIPFITYRKSLLKLKNKKISTEELLEIRNNIQTQEKYRKRIAVLVTILSLVILGVLIVLGIIELNTYEFRFRF